MNIRLGPSWKRNPNKCMKFPKTGTPYKEVYENKLLPRSVIEVYFDMAGRVIYTNADGFFQKEDLAKIFC